ncbi:MAG TPA: glycosyltransferase family 87 protein [Jatrophihabitans sp.]|nr:glycosyltransferase family 87 protein [Jatrophihabitans sp.]
MRRLWPLLLVAPALVAQVLVLWFGLQHEWFGGSILKTETVAVLLFLVALLGIWRYRGPAALLLILAGGLALQLSALGAGPSSSDDVYRYAWDGKVQLSGIDPYRYPPSADQLDRLRDNSLFPQGKTGCAWTLPDGRCSRVNRPEVRTIYPPVAEGAFTLARLLTFDGSDGPFPLQVFGAVGVLAVTGLLAWWTRRRGHPVWPVAVWAWCPVTAVEAVNNGHIDWLAALLTLAGLLAYQARRAGTAGALVGAAIATKLYPALVLPAMLRRHPVRVVGAAVGLVALSYVPHVLAVGGKVIGYLPGYLKEENYSSGTRFLLLGQVIPVPWLTKAAVLVMAVAVAWAAWRSDPDRPEFAATVLVGVGLLVTTPTYSWYVLSLLVLVAMTRRLEWLPLVIAPTIANLGANGFGNGINFRESCYAAALAAAIIGALIRVELARRSRVARTLQPA